MISISPICGIVLRHLRLLKKDPNYLLGTLYWPLLDVILWGFLGSWMQQSQSDAFSNYQTVALLCILLWQIIGRGGNIILLTFSEELWSNNIMNLFSLPLRIVEWMLASIFFYLIMISITTGFCMLFISALYDVSLWYIFSTFLIFAPSLFISGVWLGFTCLQVVILFGKRGTELAFVFAWILMPFSGALYPIDVLPAWAQTFSLYIPISYVFKGLRGYLMYQQDPTNMLITSYILGIIYALGSITSFMYLFNRSKKKGLIHLTH